jgi:hypothetical protein
MFIVCWWVEQHVLKNHSWIHRHALVASSEANNHHTIIISNFVISDAVCCQSTVIVDLNLLNITSCTQPGSAINKNCC